MERVDYKGAVICPTPKPLKSRKKGKWSGIFRIETRDERRTITQFHSTGGIYDSEEEARASCIHLAKRLIDGTPTSTESLADASAGPDFSRCFVARGRKGA